MNQSMTLILDGIFGRPRRFQRLQEALRESVGPAELFHYNCSGLIPFETLGQQLVHAIRAIAAPVNIVAFSMGGIVARVARMLEPTLLLRRAVFLNCPHRGSLLAYVAPFPGVKQLRPRSALMKELASADWPIPTLAVWCPGDLAVIPGSSARFPAAQRTIRCDVPIHPWPVWSPRIRREIVKFMNEERCASVPT